MLRHDQAGEDHGYDDFISDIDVIIMGRGTYEAVRGMGDWFYTRPVLVLSVRTCTTGDFSRTLWSGALHRPIS
ncbi:hypothetical protein QDX27_15310 [Rhizobium sp. BR 318]|nr:hypothetical protein [Rhizobium paranaense]